MFVGAGLGRATISQFFNWGHIDQQRRICARRTLRLIGRLNRLSRVSLTGCRHKKRALVVQNLTDMFSSIDLPF